MTEDKTAAASSGVSDERITAIYNATCDNMGSPDYIAFARSLLASAAPAPVVPELPEDGFVWMTHPSRFDGKPLPVWTYVQHGVRFYIPFDDTAMDFEWEERDDEWQIASSPAPERIDADKLHGFSCEDLESIADGLDCYEKTVNVGNVTGEGDEHIESTTAAAGRFIRTTLARHAAAELVSTALSEVSAPQEARSGVIGDGEVRVDAPTHPDPHLKNATRAEVLSDVDPVVLEVWKLKGYKVGAMLRDAQATVIELQEQLEETKAAEGVRPVEAQIIEAALDAPGCERLRDFYAVGPVQRAAVQAFADAISDGVREDGNG